MALHEEYKDHRLRWMLNTWLPPVLGILVICVESTEAMGASYTSAFLRPVFERIFGHINDTAWEIGHHIFRKSGHFCGYGLLSLTFLRAWYRTLNVKMSWLPPQTMWFRASALAILCNFAVACGDEFHQTFVPGRTGLFSDALLDTAGATVFQLMVWTIVRRKPGPNAGYEMV